MPDNRHVGFSFLNRLCSGRLLRCAFCTPNLSTGRALLAKGNRGIRSNARPKRNQSPARRAPQTRQKSLGPPRRNPPIRAQRLRIDPPRMARHLLPPLGHLHPGRRRGRSRRQKRRRQSRSLLHGPHPHPQRPSHQRTSPHHRRSLRPLRQQRSRHHRPPKCPTPLGPRRRSSRTPRPNLFQFQPPSPFRVLFFTYLLLAPTLPSPPATHDSPLPTSVSPCASPAASPPTLTSP